MPQWETVFNTHAKYALDVLSDLKPYQDNSHFRNGGIHYLSCFEGDVLTEKVQLDQSDDVTLIAHALSYTADPNQAKNGIGFCLYLIAHCDTQGEASALRALLTASLNSALGQLPQNSNTPFYREDLWLIGHSTPKEALCLGQFGHTYNQYLQENTQDTDLLLRLTWFAPHNCPHIAAHHHSGSDQATHAFFTHFKRALQPIKARVFAKQKTNAVQ